MKRFMLLGTVLVLLPALASANWDDDFDSYVKDTQIVGQGGWEEWGAGAGAFVRDTHSLSPANSVEIVGGTDLVHQYSETSGKWIYTANIYIPTDFTGTSYFILLNTYAFPSGPYFWSVQVGFDAVTGNLDADCGSSSPVNDIPFKKGDWSEIKVFIDLDEDWAQVYYEGTLLDDGGLADHPILGGGYQWTKGVFGNDNGALAIGAVDLFANNASAIFYDDMSLKPYLDPVPPTLSQGGGSVNLFLDASYQNGNRNYIILGSVTGTAGFPLPPGPGGQVSLPISWDIFTDIVLLFLNSGAFQNFLSATDASGLATATLNAPAMPGVPVGTKLYFAAGMNSYWDFVSNAAVIDIVP